MRRASAPQPSSARNEVASARAPEPASPRRAPGAPLLPVTDYPPVQLPHAFELFGQLKVHISTGFTFSPDTLARAVLDTSLDAVLRRHLPQWHLLIREFVYSVDGKHTPSPTTKRRLLKELAPIIPQSALCDALDGQQVATQRVSDWASMLQGLHGGGGLLNELATCLAGCDAHLLQFVAELAQQQGKAAADAHLQSLFCEELAAWRALNPRLLMQVCLLVEVALKALAWLECRADQPSAGPDPQTSCLDVLLAPGRRPMGHWLAEVCASSGCANLRKLADELHWRVTYHRKPISYDLLRKWSGSSTVLMPAAAMPLVLAGVRKKNWAETLPNRFYVARFLTFVCDLLRAGSTGEAIAPWEEVQAQVRSRYEQAYRLQVAHALDPAGSVAAAR
jgi:hypothetical protein